MESCIGADEMVHCSCFGGDDFFAEALDDEEETPAAQGSVDWSVPPAAASEVAETLLTARRQGESLSAEAVVALNLTMRRTQLVHEVMRASDHFVGWKMAFVGATCPDAYAPYAPIVAPLLGASVFSSAAALELSHPAVRFAVQTGRPAKRGAFFQRRPKPPKMLCAVEAEFCFELKADLRLERGVVFDDPPFTRASVWAAVQSVTPAVEVLGTRFEDVDLGSLAGGGGASPAATVADFCLSDAVVLGDPIDATAFAQPAAGGDDEDPPLARVTIALSIGGAVRARGSGANVMGSPLDALVHLAQRRQDLGDPLRSGDIIMTGAAAGPVLVDPGDSIRAEFNFAPLPQPHDTDRAPPLLGVVEFKFKAIP